MDKDAILKRLEELEEAEKTAHYNWNDIINPILDEQYRLNSELDATYGPQLLHKYFQLGTTSQYVYTMSIDKSEKWWRYVCVNLQPIWRNEFRIDISREPISNFLSSWHEIPETQFRELLEKEVRKPFGGQLPWEVS